MEKIELRCKLKQKTLKKNFTVLLKKKTIMGLAVFSVKLCLSVCCFYIVLYPFISFV